MTSSPLSSMNFDFDFSNMSFTSLFKKASNLLGIGSPSKPPPLDGEIIFCKNNVCVHPPAVLRSETQHHPGYLNIRSQDDEVLGQTLVLTWIPNTTLKKNPRSIENSPARSGAPLKISPRRSPRQEFAKAEYSSPSPSQSPEESAASNASDTEHRVKRSSGGSGHNSNSSSESSTPLLRKNVLVREDVQNNMVCDSPRRKRDVGKNVNDIHKKMSNAERDARSDNGYAAEGEGELEPSSENSSSDDDSPGEEKKLFNMMLAKNKLEERVKERTSSSRSVTSIEMEGDNLVVVTEEIEDSIFLDDNQTEDSKGVGESSDACVENDAKRSGERSQLLSSAPVVSQDKDLLGDSDTGASSGTTPSHSPNAHVSKLKSSLELKLQLDADGLPIDNTSDVLTTPEISITRSRTSSGSSSLTSGPDSKPPTPLSSCTGSPHKLSESDALSDAGSEGVHNCSFPNNSVTYSASPGTLRKMAARDQVCGVFSVDLGQMRSLRIFYSNDTCTSGQLVIASRESQYKILHFHNHGLDRLAEIFSEWKFLAQPRDKRKMTVAGHCKHFSVIRPYLTEGQCHPEEGAYETVNYETYKQHMNESGQIEDDFQLRKAVFFAALEPAVRPEMWPFLLHYYPYNSTFEERERLRNDKYIEYQNIRKARESMSDGEKEKFWRSTQCIVEKDVVRTDRSHPYFKGEDNPNIEILKNILLNYATAHPHYGYTQGMSDLLAPLLAEIQHEADAYWCFEGLMQKTIFVSSPKDVDMDQQLKYLQELLRVIQPRFYRHLEKVQDGMELLFVHRWILLCFKREFPEADALRMWEACWAHYQTDYFHLFLCVAIIAVYGEDVVQQDLPADEMLLHFSSLSMHMSGDVVLRKARGLLHQFRLLEKIPCTLHELCTLCGPGIWDSGHVPTVECVGNHQDDSCPFGGMDPTSIRNSKSKSKK